MVRRDTVKMAARSWNFAQSFEARVSYLRGYFAETPKVRVAILSVCLFWGWGMLYAQFDNVLKNKNNRDTKQYFVDLDTDETVRYEVPFLISSLAWRTYSAGTEFWIELSEEVDWNRLRKSVFTVEIHCGDVVIAYANNFDYPSLEPRSLGVVNYYTGQLVGTGEIYFNRTSIHIRVPLRLSPEILIYRYLPSVESAKRANGLLGAVADYIMVKRTFRGNLPGFPKRFPYQQQQGPSRWQSGEEQVVTPGTNDNPPLGDRVRGGRIWPRDISLIPGEYGIDLGNGKIIEWWLEQGWYPYPGYDGTDAWVGIVGTEYTENL